MAAVARARHTAAALRELRHSSAKDGNGSGESDLPPVSVQTAPQFGTERCTLGGLGRRRPGTNTALHSGRTWGPASGVKGKLVPADARPGC